MFVSLGKHDIGPPGNLRIASQAIVTDSQCLLRRYGTAAPLPPARVPAASVSTRSRSRKSPYQRLLQISCSSPRRMARLLPCCPECQTRVWLSFRFSALPRCFGMPTRLSLLLIAEKKELAQAKTEVYFSPRPGFDLPDTQWMAWNRFTGGLVQYSLPRCLVATESPHNRLLKMR